MAHVWSMQWKLKGHASCCTTGLNFQSNQAVSSRLKLVTRSSHEVESPKCLVWLQLTLRIPHTSYYKYLIPKKCRELPKRILKEKPKRKTRLTHPQSSSFDSPNSSTLILSIDISLRCTFSQIFILPYPYQWRGILVLWKQFRRDQFILVDAMGYCRIR